MTDTDTAFNWPLECDYINRVTDLRGRIATFDHSTATFIRYCEMQRGAAESQGRQDIVTYIQECIDDMQADVSH